MASVAPHMERYRNYVPPRGSLGLLAPTHGESGEGAGGHSMFDAQIYQAGFISPPLHIPDKTRHRKLSNER